MSPDPDSLVAHREFVEALARRLVDDRHVAEDLAQETFLAALRRPPRAAAALRGFLARVLRKRRARWLRDEERRLRKERAAARPDRAEDGGDLVARLSWHRKVVDALLALEEPYRTTLLLRFYEDLKPLAIAERLGMPPGTVRARLSRGLERMRARLDADHKGDRRSWQLGLLPLLACARPNGALLGVVAMTGTKKTVATLAIVLALAGTGYVTFRTVAPSPAAERSGAGRAAATFSEAPRPPSDSPPTEADAKGLAVIVRDQRDEPLEGAEVLLLDTMPDLDSIPLASAAERRWVAVCTEGETVAARAVTNGSGETGLRGLRGNRWDVVARAPGYGAARRTVQGMPEAPVVLRLGPARTLRGRVVDGKGTPIPGAVVLVGSAALAWSPATAERPFRAVADEQGEYLVDALPAEDVSVFAAFPRGLALHVATLRFPGPERFDITLRRGATLSGTVTDRSGRPVAMADVFVHGYDYPRGAPRDCPAHAQTDALGRYVIDTLPPCRLSMATVTAKGYAMAKGLEEVLYLLDEGSAALDFKMVRAARIRGTALGPDGPLVGAHVMGVESSKYVLHKGARTDAGGKFLLDDLAPGRVAVQVAMAGYLQDGFPSDPWYAVRTADDSEPWLLTLREGEEASFVARLRRGDLTVEGTVLGPGEVPFAGAKVLVGSVATISAADGRFRLEHVFGDFVVRAVAPGMRQVDPWPAPSEGSVVLRLERAPEPRLVGTVRGPDGAPVKGAFVLLAVPGPYANKRPGSEPAIIDEERRWYTAERCPVSASGEFEISLAGRGGNLWARASAPGMVGTDPVKIDLDERERYEASFTLRPGETLEGIVVGGRAGEAVAGATVLVRRPRPADEPLPAYALGPSEAVAAVTTADGAFRVLGLAPGWWEIVVLAGGFSDGSAKVELPARDPVRIVLAPTLSIRGEVVLRDGTPVPFAFVQVSGVPGAGRLSARSLATDEAGRFVADELVAGPYSVDVSPSRRANILRKTERPVPAGTADMRIVVERGSSISGFVVDAKGKGAPLVCVTASHDTPGGPGAWAQADLEGAFEIQGLAEGTYTLLFEDANGRDKTRVVERGVRVGTRDLRVTFSPDADERRPIEGTLVDETGAPVAERWIRTTGRTRSKTDGSGRFSIPKLEPGRHALFLESGGTKATQYVAALGEFEAGALDVHVVARSGGEIGGTVSCGGSPVANAAVVINTGDSEFPIFALTDERGAFRVSGVPPGATCSVSAGGGLFVRTNVRDVAPGTLDVRVVLTRGLTVRGRLLDSGGAPVVSGRVIATRPGAGGAAAKTDAEGRFVLTGLAAGQYDVRVELAPGEMRACGTVDAGASDVELRLG